MAFRDDDLTAYEKHFSGSFHTKARIVKAFDDLCKKKPYEKIKIEEIVAATGLSRSGFYYHFQDKNDILIWLSCQCYGAGLKETGRTLTWHEAHRRTTCYFMKFKALFVAGASCQEYRGGQPFYVRWRQNQLTETMLSYQQKEITPLIKFQIEAIPYVETAMAQKFMQGELGISLDEYCEMIVSLVPRELYEALAVPVTPAPSGDFMFLF